MTPTMLSTNTILLRMNHEEYLASKGGEPDDGDVPTPEISLSQNCLGNGPCPNNSGYYGSPLSQTFTNSYLV